MSADQRPQDSTTGDLSQRALSIARLIDRLCRAGGRYLILIEVPTHHRAPWVVEFHRLDLLQSRHLPRP